MIKIAVTGVFVDDQAKALKFYTEVLGFETKQDIGRPSALADGRITRRR